MNDVYISRGTYNQFNEYMDFINYVFGLNGKDKDFGGDVLFLCPSM